MQLKNIVFPVDFSDRSYAAAPFVQSMARRYDAKVSLIHAIPTLPPFGIQMAATEITPIYPDPYDTAALTASVEIQLREFAAEQFPHMAITCTVLSGDPANAIIDFAEDRKADLIALPTHGYGLFRRAFLGSVTTRVLREASVPVWTSAHCGEPTHRAHPQPRRIIAAIDLKDKTERVLETALALARDAGASVEILHIAGENHSWSSAFREKSVARAVAHAAASTSVLVEESQPADQLIETHSERVELVVRRLALLKRADLVVIGRGSIQGQMIERMSSHAYAVVCESPCPVISV